MKEYVENVSSQATRAILNHNVTVGPSACVEQKMNRNVVFGPNACRKIVIGSHCVVLGANSCSSNFDECVVIGDDLTASKHGDVVIGYSLFGRELTEEIRQQFMAIAANRLGLSVLVRCLFDRDMLPSVEVDKLPPGKVYMHDGQLKVVS